MKETLYNVSFSDGLLMRVWAMTKSQAKILAQATRIRNAQPYQVHVITEAKI